MDERGVSKRPGDQGKTGPVKKRPLCSLLSEGVAMRPASMSVRSNQRPASALREDLITGAKASPCGVPRPVVKTCMFMPAANCRTQFRSLRVFTRGLKSLRETTALKLKNSGKPRGAPQIPPLRYAPVGMTILFGNAKCSFQDELSSRPERTRISCHAALDRSACAPFCKGKAHEVHQRHRVQQEIRGSVVEGSAVQRTSPGNAQSDRLANMCKAQLVSVIILLATTCGKRRK